MKTILLFSALFSALLLSGAERIVSLSPNLTETVVFCGGGSMLVGRSSACDYPPETVRQLPVAGRFGIPAMEPLLALRPTLVIAENLRDQTAAAELRRLGIELLLLPGRSLDDYCANLATLGRRLKLPEAGPAARDAERKITELRRRAAEIPPGKRPRVLILFSAVPPITAGKQSFIDEAITLAGGINIAHEIDRDYFTISQEFIVAAAPDLIVVPELPAESWRKLRESPSWARLGEKPVLNGFDPDLLCRLGPRIFDGIELLRKFFESNYSGR